MTEHVLPVCRLVDGDWVLLTLISFLRNALREVYQVSADSKGNNPQKGSDLITVNIRSVKLTSVVRIRNVSLMVTLNLSVELQNIGKTSKSDNRRHATQPSQSKTAPRL